MTVPQVGTGPLAVALAVALAVQLALAANAKWRARHAGTATLLTRVFPRVPAGVFVAADLCCAALLLWPATAVAGAGLLLAAMAGAGLLGLVRRDTRGLPCGCFGVPQPRYGQRWRGVLAKALTAAAALVVLAGTPGRYPTGRPAAAGGPLTAPATAYGGSRSGWVAAILLGAALVAALVAAQPHLLRPGRQAAPAGPDDALRVLATSPQLAAWRPALLSEVPSRVSVTGSTVEVILDAWLDQRPVLLIASVTGGRVRLHARDAQTLDPLPSR